MAEKTMSSGKNTVQEHGFKMVSPIVYDLYIYKFRSGKANESLETGYKTD